MKIIVKFWKWIVAIAIFLVSLKIVNARKDIGKKVKKLDNEMEAAETKIKGKEKSIKAIHKKAGKNVQKAIDKNKKLKETQSEIRKEKSAKKSQQLKDW